MQAPVVQGIPVQANDNTRDSSLDQYTSTTCLYSIKKGAFQGMPTSYLLQGANGPCPLLAICNIMLMKRGLVLDADRKDVEFETLIQSVAGILIERGSGGGNTAAAVVEDSMNILGKLNQGLDVNIRFTSVDAFDHTKETAVLDLLRIRLFHAWIISEDDLEVYPYLSPLSYNDAVVKVAHYEEIKAKAIESGDFSSAEKHKDVVHEGETVAQWLHATSSQITSDGIIEVNSSMKNDELAIFFRNNHFSVICKNKDRLFGLVTDVGYAKTSIMWESIDQLDGDVAYFDSNFSPVAGGHAVAESDYEMALRLQYGTSNPTVAVQGHVVQQRQAPRKKQNACACTIM